MLEKLWRKRNPHSCWWESELVQTQWKIVWKLLKKLGIWPRNSSSGYLPEKFESIYSQRYVHHYVHCSISHCDMGTPEMSFNKWMDKDVVHIYSAIYYSAIKKDDILSFATTWLDLENILLNKMSVSPGWCGSVNCVPACEPKGCWFDSLSGHMPGLWARFPVESMWETTTHWYFSLSLLPPFSSV